ncbi:Chitin binding domain [Trinorchestia longiramus]|nr:Chitin binding domain [Trinorchestia longiramus]
MNFWDRISVVAAVVAACLLCYTHAAAICKEGETNTCYDCTTKGSCTKAGSNVTKGQICPSGQACIIENGVGDCKPINGSKCACTHLTFNCDLYDKQSVTACTVSTNDTNVFAPMPVFSCILPQKCISGKCAKPEIRPEKCTKDNADQRYPDPDNCKKYFTCRETKRNVYQYVLSQCLSTLVFNPEFKYCDLPANVADCP